MQPNNTTAFLMDYGHSLTPIGAGMTQICFNLFDVLGCVLNVLCIYIVVKRSCPFLAPTFLPLLKFYVSSNKGYNWAHATVEHLLASMSSNLGDIGFP